MDVPAQRVVQALQGYPGPPRMMVGEVVACLAL
jgi:hypothetical protein